MKSQMVDANLGIIEETELVDSSGLVAWIDVEVSTAVLEKIFGWNDQRPI